MLFYCSKDIPIWIYNSYPLAILAFPWSSCYKPLLDPLGNGQGAESQALRSASDEPLPSPLQIFPLGHSPHLALVSNPLSLQTLEQWWMSSAVSSRWLSRRSI